MMSARPITDLLMMTSGRFLYMHNCPHPAAACIWVWRLGQVRQFWARRRSLLPASTFHWLDFLLVWWLCLRQEDSFFHGATFVGWVATTSSRGATFSTRKLQCVAGKETHLPIWMFPWGGLICVCPSNRLLGERYVSAIGSAPGFLPIGLSNVHCSWCQACEYHSECFGFRSSFNSVIDNKRAKQIQSRMVKGRCRLEPLGSH